MPDPLYKQKAKAVGVNIQNDTLVMRKNLKDIKNTVNNLTGSAQGLMDAIKKSKATVDITVVRDGANKRK